MGGRVRVVVVLRVVSSRELEVERRAESAEPERTKISRTERRANRT